MFSKRTSWNFKINKVTELLSYLKKQGKSITDLTQSNPTMLNLNYSYEETIKPLNNTQNLIYTPDPKGLIDTRKSICRYYEKQGKEIDPDNIILTSGSSEAYNYIFRLITDPGDEILIPTPSYPLLLHLSQLNDVTLKPYRLIYDGEWYIDFNSIQNLLSSRTKILVLINPNNPTGSYIKNFEYKKLIELILKHNLVVISDEVFWDYKLKDDIMSIDSFSDCYEIPAFTINGISKLLALPQMKLGWIIVNGPADFKFDAISKLEIISDTFLSVNIPSQNALAEWFNTMQRIHNALKLRIKENYYYLYKKINYEIPAQLFNLEGGWNAILRLPNIKSDEKWVEEFLNKCSIYVQPGFFYDMEFESCIVLSLIVNPPEFRDATDKLINQILINIT